MLPVQLAESCFKAASPEETVAFRAVMVSGVVTAIVLTVEVAVKEGTTARQVRCSIVTWRSRAQAPPVADKAPAGASC